PDATILGVERAGMNDKEKEKRQRVVALHYDVQQDQAPRVVAKGAGYVAERILEIAREHSIHVHEDPDMVAVLSKLDIDAPIPENLYRAVAEVLAFVYRINQRLP
ncbi:MAG: flagellar biosynthesis protein, partial [Candidatus Hydrogenedentes bacterium]|nr:flagellar biosynthesis protein [Candidatus Hydrogenedentota bacterium]